MPFPAGASASGGAALRAHLGRRPFHTHLAPATVMRPARSTAVTAARLQGISGTCHSQTLIHKNNGILREARISPKLLTLASNTRRFRSTTTAHETSHNHRKSSFISPRYLPVLVILAIAGVAWDSQWLFPSSTSSDPAEATILSNARKFIRFDVIDKEQVSPTSFILTLKSPAPKALPSLSSLWDVFDLWCVEVKQPQIQVAREYTPLPPAAGSDPDTLRLYVRALRGGEVSTYLSRLSPMGDTVELRGPHGEFDLRSRLGAAGDRVVFLAGGTGIASALQAANAVLPGGSSMTIFWAVRSREEIQRGAPSTQQHAATAASTSSWSWNPFSKRPQETGLKIQAEVLSAEADDASPISRELIALKEKYGDKLDVRVVVDQEGTLIREPDLAAALAQQQQGPRHLGNALPPTTTDGCKFHSQEAHLGMVDGAPNAGKRLLFKDEDCACSPKDGTAAPGKNVFVISGPQGFVQAYAGPKIWRDGGQLQGPVGGMLGAIQRGNPNLLKDWIVLKL
nr:oxidoreductase FAD-binding domain-containing protein [Colletotrichum truncatum]KAF6785657.1 oxidoreductase FAD-binding domain-containing protein [Colletotrichum truncatum]